MGGGGEWGGLMDSVLPIGRVGPKCRNCINYNPLLGWVGGGRSEVWKPLKSNTFGCVPLLDMTMCTWCPLGQVTNTCMVQTRTPKEQVVPIGLGCSALRSSYNPHWYPSYFIFFYVGCDQHFFLCIIHFAWMFHSGRLLCIRSVDNQTNIKMSWQDMDV